MRTYEDKYNRIRKQARYLAWFAIGSFAMTLMESTNILWLVPLIVSYMGMGMANADCDRLKNQIKHKFGGDEEEYY